MRKYFIILFISFCTFIGKAQQHYSSYERSLILYNDSKNKIDFIGKIIYDMQFHVTDDDTSAVKNERMELLYNDSVSVFQNIRKGIKDSVLNELFERKQKLRVLPELGLYQENLGLTSILVLKNNMDILVQDNYTNYLENTDKLFFYKEKIALNWVLSDDTIHVLNYVCQKATLDYGGRKWEAWFAPQIPISDGPYKFSGLPGLILKMYDTEKSWQFECIGIEKSNRAVILMSGNDQKKKTVSKKEYFKIRNDYLSNQIYYDEKNLDAIYIDNPPLKNKQDRFYRERNKRLNHIEKNIL